MLSSFVLTILLAVFVLATGVSTALLVRQQRLMLHQQHQLRREGETIRQQALKDTFLAQEEEKQRLATDLYDGVGTTLSLIKLHLNDPAHAAETTHETTALLDQAIGEIRRISRNLLPATLQKVGLCAALEALARSVQANGPTRVQLAQHGTSPYLTPTHELTTYRVVQELLTNGLQRAQAPLISLNIDYGPTAINLHYSDNGIGFDIFSRESVTTVDFPPT